MSIIIGLSTNLNNKHQNLIQAKEQIQLIAKILKQSSIYETKAWGIQDQPDYLNQIITIQTSLSPEQLLSEFQKIEIQLGRTKNEKYGPRIIDIDILFYDNLIINTPTLTIPHSQIQNRNFILIPLLEIEPELIHPKLKLPIKTIFSQCQDTLEVKKLEL
jgi:2-amino-4-hydroxy-6-hydroxymethyldihydropteridine diphosphokinase